VTKTDAYTVFLNVYFYSVAATGKLTLATTQEQERYKLCVGVEICFFSGKDVF